jgi:hypothetical protein
MLSHVEYGHDAGMIECGGDPGLAFEALQEVVPLDALGFVVGFDGDHFDGHVAVQAAIYREIDFAHATMAQFPNEFEVID